MDTKKKESIYRTIMLVILTILITSLVTAIFMYRYMQDDGNTKYILVSGNDSDLGTELAKFRAIIDQYYLGDIDEEALREGAIKGYVEGLGDEYSEYIPKSEYEDYNESLMGNFIGIGIYMGKYKESGETVILATMLNSPAEKAGLESGDIITKIDGVSCANDDLDAVSDKLKGEEGTTVNIEIKRGDDIFNLDIVREKVIENPVNSEVLENNIGYIKISSFDEDTSLEFKSKYEELASKNIKGLIIDLRNNGGGIVDDAVAIADYIIPKEKDILITVNKREKEKIEKSKEDPIVTVPVVVLVNGNTASSSEILAGALKDNNCATIIGTKTYGKGIIQEVLKLADGSGIKLTTEEYFTPNRTKINKVGIEPDITVELPEGISNGSSVSQKEDTQLQRAISELK